MLMVNRPVCTMVISRIARMKIEISPKGGLKIEIFVAVFKSP
jgi:hypothetical protein